MRKVLLMAAISALMSVIAFTSHAFEFDNGAREVQIVQDYTALAIVDISPGLTPAVVFTDELSSVASSDNLSQDDNSQSCGNCYTQSGITDKLSHVRPGNGIMHTRYVSFHPDRKGFQRKC